MMDDQAVTQVGVVSHGGERCELGQGLFECDARKASLFSPLGIDKSRRRCTLLNQSRLYRIELPFNRKDSACLGLKNITSINFTGTTSR